MSHVVRAGCLALLPFALFADEPRTIGGWGEFVDPKGDCRITASAKTLEIEVPATLHDLNPRNGALSAPRILQEVTGDFAVKVRVTAPLRPGARSTAPRSLPFQSAGLLVWGDDKNYVRLERNAWSTRNGPRCYAPLLEVFAGGVDQRTNPRNTTVDYFGTPATTLVLVREGDWLSAHVSHDGNEWEVVKNVRARLPERVHVGVAVINTSDGPITAKFDEFELRRTKTTDE